MSTSRTMNMTEGNTFRLLTVFSIPMLIGNLFQQAYNLADSMIVGKFLGADALAAVGATGAVTFLFFSVCNGISSGGGIITSRYFGAGDDANVKKSIANSAYIMFSISILTGLIAYLLTPTVLNFMGTPKSILPDSITYMRMSCIGVPFIGIYNYASSMLRALGDSRTPLYFLIISCFLNVCMDLFFVKVLNLGVFGAAFATIIAQFLSGFGCLLYALKRNPYFHLSREDRQPDRRIIWQAVRLGLPLAMQWSLIAISTSALQRFVNGFGTVAMAAFTATNRVEQLIQQPFGSLSSGLSTYSAQNYGAGKFSRLKEGFRDSMLITAAISLLALLAARIFSNEIISWFVNEKEVIEMGGEALKITSWFYIFLGTIYAARGILNGVGDILFSFINGFIEMLSRIFLPMLIVAITTLGVWSIWWTAGLAWFLSAFFCVLRYVFWKRKHAALLSGATEAAN